MSVGDLSAFLSGGSTKTASSSATALASDVSRAADTMHRAEFAEMFITRALLALELERWARERLAALREMWAMLGAGNVALAERLGTLWKAMITQSLSPRVRESAELTDEATKDLHGRARRAMQSVEVVRGLVAATGPATGSAGGSSGGTGGAGSGAADGGGGGGGGGD